jgi:hypothetical protein
LRLDHAEQGRLGNGVGRRCVVAAGEEPSKFKLQERRSDR